MNNDTKIQTSLLTAADNHGEDSGEPDHTVGDLQGLVKLMWALLTPSQRLAVLESDEVIDLAIAGARDEWDETDLVSLHQQDMAALDSRMRDLGYSFQETELGVRWETADEVDVEKPTHDDALWDAYQHYLDTRRQALLAKRGPDFLTYLETETGLWHDARIQPVTLREHLGILPLEYAVFLKDPAQFQAHLEKALT